MFSPKTLKEDSDWANLGDFRQKLPEHPLPFSPVPANPPLRSRPNFLTPIASALASSIGLIRSGNHGIFYLVLLSSPALVPFSYICVADIQPLSL
jgi:hypothetical protein